MRPFPSDSAERRITAFKRVMLTVSRRKKKEALPVVHDGNPKEKALHGGTPVEHIVRGEGLSLSNFP
jgi:hypothetical protein